MPEPIKIGWLGAALDGPGGGYDKLHRMAFDEASESGLLDRPVEHVLHAENGLPNGSARNATDGFRWLVDQGCIAVAGAYSSDNAITVAPLANELQVPLISWAGTDRLQGEYCFRLGNGDVGGDATLVVAWLKKQGYERVAVLSEISPNGEEYFRYFRQEARRRDLRIAAVETVTQSPADLAVNLESLRDGQPDALVYMGYGMLAAKGLLREALDKLGWDPPRIMGTAFMFYLMGFDKFEGWVGIDQLDPTNPLVPGSSTGTSPATARTRRCGPTPSRSSPTTPRGCSWRGSSARRSSRARASRPASKRSGSCPAPPAENTPTSRARPTNTACSAATGSSTDASPTANSNSKASSNSGSSRHLRRGRPSEAPRLRKRLTWAPSTARPQS